MFLLISFRSDIIVPQILLPLKVPQISQINTVFLPSPAIPRRSQPAKYGEGFDAPPTLERSGSEHRRAVTSPLPEEEGLGEKVEPSLAKEGRGGSKNLTGWIEKPHHFSNQKKARLQEKEASPR